MPSRACRCVAPCGVASAGSWGRHEARTIARPTLEVLVLVFRQSQTLTAR